jgi:hypothetical protein
VTDFPPPWYQPTPVDEETPASAAGLLRYGSGFVDKSTLAMNGDVSPTGDEPGKCNAWGRQAQRPCRKPAGWGTDHVGEGRCRLHGGKTKTHVKNAQKAIAKAGADTYGLPIDVDPAQALLDEVHRTAGHVAWLGAIVAAMRKGDLGWGVTKVKRGGEDFGTTYESKLNVYLSLYQDERKHLTRVCETAIKAGVEQKRLTLETHRAELMVKMLEMVFGKLELTPEQSEKLEELVPEALKSLAELESK